MGTDAEMWMALELRQLDRKRCSVIHVPLPGRADVDHVAIGPGCVYAVEMKWTTYGSPSAPRRPGTATAQKSWDDWDPKLLAARPRTATGSQARPGPVRIV